MSLHYKLQVRLNGSDIVWGIIMEDKCSLALWGSFCLLESLKVDEDIDKQENLK